MWVHRNNIKICSFWYLHYQMENVSDKIRMIEELTFFLTRALLCLINVRALVQGSWLNSDFRLLYEKATHRNLYLIPISNLRIQSDYALHEVDHICKHNLIQMNKMTDSSRLSSWPLTIIIVSVHKNLFVYLAGVTNCHSIKTSINDISKRGYILFCEGKLARQLWWELCFNG